MQAIRGLLDDTIAQLDATVAFVRQGSPQMAVQIPAPPPQLQPEAGDLRALIAAQVREVVEAKIGELVAAILAAAELAKRVPAAPIPAVIPPCAEASLARAPGEQAVAQACFAAPRRAVAVANGQAVPVDPVVDRSRYFVMNSVGVGDLPIGDWSVRPTNEGEIGTDWNALPFPAAFKKNVKELETLMQQQERAPLNEADSARKAELEKILKIST